MKTLAVVVPIYNTAPYLRQCIDSLISQTRLPDEIILVDDGSTDGSGVICDEYACCYDVVSVIHQPNLGMPRARYRGIRSAKSDFITFVDSDDWIDCNTYQEIFSYDEDCDAYFFSHVRYYPDGRKVMSHYNFPSGFYDKKDIETRIIPYMIWDVKKQTFGLEQSIWSKIFRKSILIEEYEGSIQFEFTYGEDCSITWPIVTKLNSLYISDKAFYYYRQRESGQIPSYITNINFNHKLTLLYDYLADRLGMIPGMIKQLDYFYCNFSDLRLLLYHDRRDRHTYVFPFQKVPFGSKVVLYAAGNVGREYHRQLSLLHYCDIVAWVDQSNRSLIDDISVQPPTILREKSLAYDYVVIAVDSERVSQEITHNLLNMGIPNEKIIWSIRYYNQL